MNCRNSLFTASTENFSGVELAADPLLHVPVVLVLRVADRCEEVGVAPRPAAVLGRAGPLPFDAPGVLGLGLPLDGPLEQDLVPPAVAEVVLVDEPGLPSPLTIWLSRTPSSSSTSMSIPKPKSSGVGRPVVGRR